MGFKKLKQVIDEVTVPTVYQLTSTSEILSGEVSINTKQLCRMKSGTSDAHKIAHSTMMSDN